MLLMVKKGIRGGMCQAIHWYAKAKNKYMKNYEKNIESSYLMHLDANSLYGWAMSQKLPLDSFEQLEDLSQFKEDFKKNYNGNSDKGYFVAVDVEYPKKLFNRLKDLQFLPERMKIKKCSKLICNIQDKKDIFCSQKDFKTSTKSRINTKKSP